jgi:hypothetical protein
VEFISSSACSLFPLVWRIHLPVSEQTRRWMHIIAATAYTLCCTCHSLSLLTPSQPPAHGRERISDSTTTKENLNGLHASIHYVIVGSPSNSPRLLSRSHTVRTLRVDAATHSHNSLSLATVKPSLAGLMPMCLDDPSGLSLARFN